MNRFKLIFFIIFAFGSFYVIFGPSFVFAEEAKIEITEISPETEKDVNEDEPGKPTEDAEEEIKPEEKESEKIEKPIEIVAPQVNPVESSVQIEESPKLAKKKIGSDSVRIAPLKAIQTAPVSSTPTVAAAIPRKVIPANPSFTPNEYPKNGTLVLFSKIRPALIIIAVLYFLVSTLYLKKDAAKWKQSHWQ